MINYTHARIKTISVHQVGNKTNGEDLHLSQEELTIDDLKLKELLFQFFLQPFVNPEFHSFTFTNQDHTLNPLFIFSKKMFSDDTSIHQNSIHIAKHLYELATHPQIKSGDLFIVYFTGIELEGRVADAIGIFKSETKQSFLKLDNSSANYNIQYDDGINPDKLDKGCLIFNTDRDSGYRICMIDKSNKSAEAQYWKDDFLKLRPCADDYHQTKNFLSAYKTFVTEQLPQEYEVNKTDQIDLLNKSMNYFQTNEQFNEREFTSSILEDQDVISSFKKFKEGYEIENGVEIDNRFDISSPALKKQSKIFKSVLKLDKNFHVYIHGKRELIEQGIESDGRKYYKIYYEQES